MATLYETVKSAISAALSNADPTLRILDRLVHPTDTSFDKLAELFGAQDPGTGEVQQTTEGGVLLNAAIYTRRIPGSIPNVFGTGPSDEVRRRTSDWYIKVIRSYQDPANSDAVDVPSEYAFQNLIDTIQQELYLNAAMTELMTSAWKIVVEDVQCTDAWFEDFAGEQRCHVAEITLMVSHFISNNL